MRECIAIIKWGNGTASALVFNDRGYRDLPDWYVWGMSAFKGDGTDSARKSCFWKAVTKLEEQGYLRLFKNFIDLNEDVEHDCYGNATAYVHGNAYPVAEWVYTDLVL